LTAILWLHNLTAKEGAFIPNTIGAKSIDLTMKKMSDGEKGWSA
jgi:hypothetical protein